MKFEQLLSALSLETRLDLAAAAQSGGCTIQFDGSLEVTIEASDRNGAGQVFANFWTTLGTAPLHDAETLFGRLLQIQLFGLATSDGVFSYDPPTRRILFFRTFPLDNLSDNDAVSQAQAFVDQATRWREFLPELSAPIAAPSDNATLLQTA